MAAIGHSIRLTIALLFLSTSIWAGQPEDVLAAVNHIATALSNNDPADAMKAFSKSCKDYALLSEYFNGLTARALVENEVEVVEENDSDSETKLTVQWALTLSDKTNGGQGEQRNAQLHLRLIREENKWKIVELAPADFFDPAVKEKSK